MLKKSFTLLAVLVFTGLSVVFAQSPSRISIRGTLKDTAGFEVVTATVMLLNPTDSTLVNFTASDKSGNFRFLNVKNDDYLLKIQHISYMPIQQNLSRSNVQEVNLGEIPMVPFSQVLMQVVVREAKAPIRIHGDTVEYDVSTFKVPPGSTVEDLLKKLPGIEVDQSGNVSAQGKNVRRIMVDGKSFFGDDPKTVTQNLGSEAIRKVQVYDHRSEQSRLTGVPDASQEKAMNLELKEEYKKGSFGKATLAGGTQERWAARGNYNRFDEKQQLSFIGYGNNINQSGVNWDDYQEFKGQAGFAQHDNGDFGFGQGGGFYSRRGMSLDVPISRDSDRGFSNNAGLGANYNFDNKKTQFNATYFFSHSTLFLEQQTYKQTFLPDSSYFNRDTLDMTDARGNHSIGLRFETEIDSSQRIIGRVNMNIIPTNTQNFRAQHFSSESLLPVNTLTTDNITDNLSTRFNSLVIYGKKYKKTGRALALSGAYILNTTSGEEDLNAINRFFAAGDFTEQVRQLNQENNASRIIKSSALFSEGLSKRFYLEGFANFSATLQQKGTEVTNPLLVGDQRIDSLSLYFTNNRYYYRVGSSLRYSHKGMNLTAGVAVQQIDLDGLWSSAEGEPLNKAIDRSFVNITPNVSLTHQFPNRMWLQASYSYEIDPPSMSDLAPRPVITNPLFRTEGNPDLEPETSHALSASLNYWAPASFASFGMWSSYNLYDSRIVYNLRTSYIDSVGYRTITRPENIAGADQFNASAWSSLPLIKTVLTMNINAGFRFGNSKTYINDQLNETANTGYSGSLGFNLTPGNFLQFSLRGSLSFSNINYSLQSSQDQKIENHDLSATIRLLFLRKTFFESNFSYNLYRNDRFGFDETIPLWNASVRRIFGSKNRIEARFAAFDIFNKRLGITQTGAQNYVLQTTSNTLARYYMLSVSYNIKGYDIKMQQQQRGRRRG